MLVKHAGGCWGETHVAKRTEVCHHANNLFLFCTDYSNCQASEANLGDFWIQEEIYLIIIEFYIKELFRDYVGNM